MNDLKKELAATKLENEDLKIRLNNALLMLRREMLASGSLPKLAVSEKQDR
jgi:hypothetical protein